MVTSTSGMLIAKIQRQEALSTSCPPISGPSTLPIPPQAVQAPTACRARPAGTCHDHRQRRRGEQRAGHTLERAAATSTSIVGATAQSSEVAPKPATPEREHAPLAEDVPRASRRSGAASRA